MYGTRGQIFNRTGTVLAETVRLEYYSLIFSTKTRLVHHDQGEEKAPKPPHQ